VVLVVLDLLERRREDVNSCKFEYQEKKMAGGISRLRSEGRIPFCSSWKGKELVLIVRRMLGIYFYSLCESSAYIIILCKRNIPFVFNLRSFFFFAFINRI